MPIIAALLFVALLIASNAFIVETTGILPERVASHFGGNNLPNGWMSRSGYLAFMLSFAGLLPVVVTAVVGGLPRLFPGAINIPHREYWLAPTRRDTTIGFLAAHACWLGSMLTVFVAGIHYLLLQAHMSAPPRLPVELFWTMLATFLGAIGVWIGTLVMRFRTTG